MTSADRMQGLSGEQRRRLEERLLKRMRESSAQPAETGAPPPATAVPLSPAQRGVWLAHRMDPTGCAYNLALHTRIEGRLDVGLFGRAFDAVVARHAALRTALRLDPGGQVVQVVTDARAPLPFDDLAGLGPEECERVIRQYADQIARAPFDLTVAPPLRARLVRLEEQNHVLLLVVHHLFVDGGSARILFRDLLAAYNAFRSGSEPTGPAAGLLTATADPGADDLAYWQARLAGHPGMWDPVIDLTRTAGDDVGRPAGRVPLHVGQRQVEQLRELAASSRTSPFMLLLTAVTFLAARFGRQDDLVIGVPVDNRDRWHAEDVIGLFADFMPIRVVAEEGQAFSTLLDQVRTSLLEGFAHREASFDSIVRAVAPARIRGRSPLFQVVFTYQEEPAHPADARLRLSYADLGIPRANFDLTVCLVGTDEGLDGYVEYDAALFLPATASQLAERLASMIGAILRNPGLPLARLVPDADVTAAPPVVADLTSAADADAAGGTASGSDPLTELMAGLWTEVLGVEGLEPADDYLALGGHSLNATQLTGRIREAFGVEVPLYEVLAPATVQGLSDYVRDRISGRREEARDPIEPGPQDGDLPLSAAQQRMWILSALEPGVPMWTVPLSLRAEGVLDLEAWARALTEVVARHAVLRSSFPVRDGQPVQRVHDAAPVPIEMAHLRGRVADAGEAEAWLHERMAEPFDLTEGPVLRAYAARLTDRSWLLLVNVHHIAMDRWSMENLFTELSACYEAFADGEPLVLPPLPIQYSDFARWQRNWLGTDDALEQLGYWRGQLREPPAPVRLSFQRDRPPVRARRGRYVDFEIQQPVRAAVQELAVAERATPFMVLFAAFLVVLHRAGAGTDFIVGTPIAGRDRPELEPLIGCFINTLPIRADLSGDPTFREHLARVRQTTIGAYARQEIPIDRMVEELAPHRVRNRDAFFDVMFTFQNVPQGSGLQLPGVKLTLFYGDAWVAKRDLTFRVEDTARGTHGSCEYDTELFAHTDIEQFVDRYLLLLADTVRAPAMRISTTPAHGGRYNQHAGKEDDMGNEPEPGHGHKMFEKILAMPLDKVRVGVQDEVTMGLPADADAGPPYIIEARNPGLDLIRWADDNSALIDSQLGTHGGIMFRGFDVGSPAVFRAFAAARIRVLLDYNERSTPRSETGAANVYTSTEYPPDQYIELHNEMSYAHVWPRWISFYCHHAAAGGGATPVADTRQIYASLPSSIRDRFADTGVMYVRNYGTGVDLSWPEAFQTSDRVQVERYCREAGIDWEWLGGEGLRTRQVRPAVLDHPVTGERVWFNSAHMFHVAALEPSVRTSLLGMLGEAGLPRHAYYGDGSPIPAETIEEIRATYRRLTVALPWQGSDVMLLDNMLACHGRQPFQGEREVLVAFGDPVGVDGGRASIRQIPA